KVASHVRAASATSDGTVRASGVFICPRGLEAAQNFLLLAGGQEPGLLDPALALDAATKLEGSLYPFDVGCGPCRDLPEGGHARLVQQALVDRADANDLA